MITQQVLLESQEPIQLYYLLDMHLHPNDRMNLLRLLHQSEQELHQEVIPNQQLHYEVSTMQKVVVQQMHLTLHYRNNRYLHANSHTEVVI
jgi:hypothetical protein